MSPTGRPRVADSVWVRLSQSVLISVRRLARFCARACISHRSFRYLVASAVMVVVILRMVVVVRRGREQRDVSVGSVDGGLDPQQRSSGCIDHRQTALQPHDGRGSNSHVQRDPGRHEETGRLVAASRPHRKERRLLTRSTLSCWGTTVLRCRARRSDRGCGHGPTPGKREPCSIDGSLEEMGDSVVSGEHPSKVALAGFCVKNPLLKPIWGNHQLLVLNPVRHAPPHWPDSPRPSPTPPKPVRTDPG